MGRTFRQALADHATQIFLRADQFAETVVRYPEGNLTSPIEVTGLWTPDLQPMREMSMNDGERVVLHGTLDLSATTTLAYTDQWLIGGLLYQTESIMHPRDGIRSLRLRRDDKKATTNSNPGRLR